MNKILKVTEAHIQTALMRWVMIEKQHICILPNSNQFFSWEADLLSINKSWFVNEYEIKLNIQDYRRDAEKQKHHWLGSHDQSPAYFWYATYDFDIDPPERAGFLKLSQKENSRTPGGWYWDVQVVKKAPRLNKWTPDVRDREQIIRLLSWRLYRSFRKQYMSSE